MFDEFIEWAQAVIGGTYNPSRGIWVDSPQAAGLFIAAYHQTGGPMPQVDVRRPRFRVILLGPRDGRQHTISVQNSAEALMQATLGDLLPCGAARVAAMEPVGPGFTEENRPFFSLDFELIF